MKNVLMKNAMLIVCVLLVILIGEFVPGFVRAVRPAEEAVAETLLPAYSRTSSGTLVDTEFGSWIAANSVTQAAPFAWWKTLGEDEELVAWLDRKISQATNRAHAMGVSGYADRKAFWAATVESLRDQYLDEVAKRYTLSPKTTAKTLTAQ